MTRMSDGVRERLKMGLRETRHYLRTLLLLLSGFIVDATPRRFLPDRFVRWYNASLDTWTWDAP